MEAKPESTQFYLLWLEGRNVDARCMHLRISFFASGQVPPHWPKPEYQTTQH